MDSFELNKILGALLGTCLVLLAVHIASGAIFAPPVAGQARLRRRGQTGDTRKAERRHRQRRAGVPIETLLVQRRVQQGAQTAKQCELCHNLGKGQGAKIGPDLYGVVGPARWLRKPASIIRRR